MKTNTFIIQMGVLVFCFKAIYKKEIP